MTRNTPVVEPAPAAMGPARGSDLGQGSAACQARHATGRAWAMVHPAGKAIIGTVWFCTALAILWFFGSLAMAPWERAARTGTMRLPGGAHLDLTLGHAAPARCAVQVTREGKSSEFVITRSACSKIAIHRWLAANRQLPQFEGAALGVPYTIAPPPAALAKANRIRLVVSCLFTVAAGLAGALLMLGSIAVAARLMSARPQPSPDTGKDG